MYYYIYYCMPFTLEPTLNSSTLDFDLRLDSNSRLIFTIKSDTRHKLSYIVLYCILKPEIPIPFSNSAGTMHNDAQVTYIIETV
jgi:hypothetical protein